MPATAVQAEHVFVPAEAVVFPAAHVSQAPRVLVLIEPFEQSAQEGLPVPPAANCPAEHWLQSVPPYPALQDVNETVQVYAACAPSAHNGANSTSKTGTILRNDIQSYLYPANFTKKTIRRARVFWPEEFFPLPFFDFVL